METIRVVLQLPRRNIVRLCSLVEGYEGYAVLRTVDPRVGVVELLTTPAFHAAVLTLLQALAPKLDVVVLDAGSPL